MYFNFLPSINYGSKPISYPFSESDFVVAKNFFRKFNINDTAYNSAVYYNKVAVPEGQRLEQISEVVYGSPNYDWVIALTNNMMNPLQDLPMSESDLRDHVESNYKNPYYDVHHYEIISNAEQERIYGKVLIEGGTWVDKMFYEGDETYIPADLPQTVATVDRLPWEETIALTNQSVYPPDGIEPDITRVDPTGSFGEISGIQMAVYDFGAMPRLGETEPYRDPRILASAWQFNQGGSSTESSLIETKVQDLSLSEQVTFYMGVNTSPAPGDELKFEVVIPQGFFSLAFELGRIDLNYFSENANPDSTYSTEVTWDIDENYRVDEAFFRITYIPDGTGIRDEYILAGWSLIGGYDVTRPLGYEVTQIDEENYVIDGTKWRNDGTAWTKQTKKGYIYNDDGVIKETNGSILSRPVTEFEYEQTENEKKREIYILKPNLLDRFVDDFKKASLYKKSSDYVSNRLKQTGI